MTTASPKPDRPVGFGYKLAWYVVKSNDYKLAWYVVKSNDSNAAILRGAQDTERLSGHVA
jgi:hypothetical protein